MTNNYYDENGEEFFKNTVNADISENYENFLKKIPKNGLILDAGCGSGRDTRMFKKKGFNVIAMDGSLKMCKLASSYLNSEVLHIQFQEIDFFNKFDGIWASASLLHLNSADLLNVLKRLKKALKKNGVLYSSFKYGDFEGERNGRYFNDFTEESVKELFGKFEILKIWITNDVRKNRENEKWVNVLVRK